MLKKSIISFVFASVLILNLGSIAITKTDKQQPKTASSTANYNEEKALKEASLLFAFLFR